LIYQSHWFDGAPNLFKSSRVRAGLNGLTLVTQLSQTETLANTF